MKSASPGKPKKCPVTVGFSLEGECRVIFCGQWMCPDCAKRLAKRWAKQVRDHIAFNRAATHAATGEYPADFWFITLTLGSRYRTTKRGFEELPKLWQRLHKAMRRKYPDWQYVAFVEGQPRRGFMPHFHIISNQPLPVKPNKHGRITQHATHDYAHKMGWGFEADQEQVTGAKNASYIAKYASKQSPKTPRGFRRVRASRSWRKLPRDPTKLLIVKARGEGMVDFIQRVTEFTGLSYSQAYIKFYAIWKKHQDKLGSPPRKW
jgi:hypothetical protein